jgi:uncharacterized protein (TIGR02996 family)
VRRFERLMVKPVAVREIDVDGSLVIEREGLVGEALRETSSRHATAAAATAHVEALVKQWRADGYIPITRVAPVGEELPVRRGERRDWIGRDGSKEFIEIEQRDKKVRSIHGRVVDGDDYRDEPEVFDAPMIKDASAYYDRLLLQRDRDIAEDKQLVEAKERKATEQRAAQLAAKQRAGHERVDHAALEAQCRASPEAPGPWLVYADWLQERGEPLGEAAGLALNGDVEAAKALLRSSFAEFHPTADDEEVDDDSDDFVDNDAHIELHLRHGFIAGVTLNVGFDASSAEMPALIKRVLSSPACRFVDDIQLGLVTAEGYANTWENALRAICATPHARWLRALRLNAYTTEDCELSWVPYGDLSAAWASLPALELLHIRAGLDGQLGDLALPNLRTFIFESGGLRRNVITSLLAQPRARLTHLELWTGTAHYGAELGLEDIQPILDGKLPGLTHLGIVNSELSDVIIPALATSRILPRLESLDLSRGIFAQLATDALVQHAPAFRHLACLDLSANVLHDEEVERIREVLDNVIVGEQRPADREDDIPDEPGSRYTAVGE